REVGRDGALQHVRAPVVFARLLPLGNRGPDTGRSEERGDTGAAGADALGEGALRRELDLELAAQVLALELLVLADVARDHLLDLTVLQQYAEARAVDARVVRDHGEVPHPFLGECGDEI